MDDPTTKPSGSKPASPSSTYSDTDRSEVNTPPCLAPAVSARRLSAACGSQVASSWSCPRLNNGMVACSLDQLLMALVVALAAGLALARAVLGLAPVLALAAA